MELSVSLPSLTETVEVVKLEFSDITRVTVAARKQMLESYLDDPSTRNFWKLANRENEWRGINSESSLQFEL